MIKYCLGTVQFGTNYGIQGNGQPQREAVYNILNYAIEYGITQFDTASAYGEAENVLGEYIRSNPEHAGKLQIVSKLKPDAFTNANKADWKQIAIDSAKESLNLLGVNRFSAYLFHNASYIFDKDAVDALFSVQKSGLADCVGVSIYSPDEAMKALSYPQIGAIQIPYNLFDRRLDKCGFFIEAQKRGIILYARSSLLQGLAVMDPENLPDRVSFAKDYLLRYDALCQEFSVSKLNAAIGYVAQKKEIDYVAFGVDNRKQLEEYLSQGKKSLPKELIERIDNEFNDVPENLVNPVMWK